MNRSSQSSRRSSFALLSIEVFEEPEYFTDEHLHQQMRNIQIDIDTEMEDDELPFNRTHVPSWGASRRRGLRDNASDISEITDDFSADFFGHRDSFVSIDTLDKLFASKRDSLSLAGRRGVPRSQVRGQNPEYDKDETFDFYFEEGTLLCENPLLLSVLPTFKDEAKEDQDDKISFRDETFVAPTFKGNSVQDDRDLDEDDDIERLSFFRRDSLSVARGRMGSRNICPSGISLFASALGDLFASEDFEDDSDDDDELIVIWPKHEG